ncbi:hypothetical protein O3M35_005152 [Rhynocoris fuscipes]
MILPKNNSKMENVESAANSNSSLPSEIIACNKDNCLVSPILLKKKSKPRYYSPKSERPNKQSDLAENINECDMEKFKKLSLTSECRVVVTKSPLLDRLATKNMSISLEVDLNNKDIKSTPVRSLSRNSLVKSAKKKLDLTPSSSVKRNIGHGFLTPVISEKSERHLSRDNFGDIDQTRIKLQASTVPESLPCRSNEFNNIRTFVIRKIQDETGGCMYISGVPGTGKTATVHAVIKGLQGDSLKKSIPPFDFVEINGLRLTEPRQSYVRIWQTLTNEKVPVEQALRNLEKKFRGRPVRNTVILVDELDYLFNKRQDVIYNLLEWTTLKNSKLVILTIANTMDLPERTLKGKITSRMGLTRLIFQPYTHQQLQEIVTNRLGNCKNFHPDAIQLVARKVAAISGDARRALDICRRAVETLDGNEGKTISVFDIDKVISGTFTGIRVQAIKNCSRMGKFVLRAIRDEVSRTGVEETTFNSLFNQLITICTLEGIAPEPNPGDVSKVINYLTESGLILAERDRKDLKRKVSLNVSPDDIHYAMME